MSVSCTCLRSSALSLLFCHLVTFPARPYSPLTASQPRIAFEVTCSNVRCECDSHVMLRRDCGGHSHCSGPRTWIDSPISPEYGTKQTPERDIKTGRSRRFFPHQRQHQHLRLLLSSLLSHSGWEVPGRGQGSEARPRSHLHAPNAQADV